jgi:hypothetical protein
MFYHLIHYIHTMNYTLTLESLSQRIHITSVSESLKQISEQYSNPPTLPIDIDSDYVRQYNLTHKLREIYTHLATRNEKLIKIDCLEIYHSNSEPNYIDYVVIGVPSNDQIYELNIFILNSSNKYLVSKILHIEKILEKLKQDIVNEQTSLLKFNEDMYTGKESYVLRLKIMESEIKTINCALDRLQTFDEKIMEISISTNKLTYLVEELMGKVNEITLGKLFKNLSWKQIIALASLLITISTFGSSISTVLKREVPNLKDVIIELIVPD